MRQLRIILQRIRSLFLRRAGDDDLAREIDIHIEQLTRELIASGTPPAEARLQARRQFGSLAATTEQCRDMRRIGAFDNFHRDVLYAVRLLRNSPCFTATAIVSLVLGIGANTAMFQLFEAVRLRSLPVDRPAELVALRISGEGRSGNFRGRNGQFTYAVWDEVRRRQNSFASVFAYGDTPVNLSRVGEMRNVEGLWVSGGFFSALGVKPVIGRVLTEQDDRPGCGSPGVVLGHAFWQREFGGDPSVLSQNLPVNGRNFPILGVTPPSFFGVEVGRRFDVAIPICSAEERDLSNRMFWFLSVMGRLKPGVSASAAQTELLTISPPVFESTVPPYQPRDQARYRQLQLTVADGEGGQSGIRESLLAPLTILLSMVFLVLLLACANLANMMLARATAREHEFAVRRSLGASRWRLVRQVLIESLLLAVAGAAIGVAAAPAIGDRLLMLLSTARDPLYLQLETNWSILAYAVTAAVAATVLFGLAPALQAAAADTRGASASRDKQTLRRGLLVVQMALCMLLLTAAFQFSRSFRNLLDSSPGFDAHGVLVAHVFLDARRHPPERRQAIIADLQGRLSATPGVVASSRSYVIPVSGSGWDRGVRIMATDQPKEANLTSIGPDYFRVMRMSLLAGRDFAQADTPASTPVAIVNQAFARAFFDGCNPVGQTLRLDAVDQAEPPFEIVGLTVDSRYTSLAEQPGPIVYFAASQERVPHTTVRFVLRVSGTPQSAIAQVKQTLLDADPNFNLRFVVLREQLEQSVLRERLLAVLTSAFGLLGMMLAVTGVFGITAYIVSRRYREFGVRLAMGATSSGIVAMIVREMALISGAGIVLGGLLSYGLTVAFASILYGVSPHDPFALLAVSGVLAISGLIASAIPAFRASRIAPIEALRLD